MIQLQLSPETPLARDGCQATRSVLRAGTTHHLATGLHEAKGYFPGRPLVKGKALLKIRCTAFKKVIHDHQKYLRLPALRGGTDLRGGLDGVQLGPAFIEIGLTQLGDLILVRTSAIPILVVKHLYHLHSLSIDIAEGCQTLPVHPALALQIYSNFRLPPL